MENVNSTKSTESLKSSIADEEALRKACEAFRKKAKASNYKLTYDGNGKITACRWG